MKMKDQARLLIGQFKAYSYSGLTYHFIDSRRRPRSYVRGVKFDKRVNLKHDFRIRSFCESELKGFKIIQRIL